LPVARATPASSPRPSLPSPPVCSVPTPATQPAPSLVPGISAVFRRLPSEFDGTGGAASCRSSVAPRPLLLPLPPDVALRFPAEIAAAIASAAEHQPETPVFGGRLPGRGPRLQARSRRRGPVRRTRGSGRRPTAPRAGVSDGSSWAPARAGRRTHSRTARSGAALRGGSASLGGDRMDEASVAPGERAHAGLDPGGRSGVGTQAGTLLAAHRAWPVR
jgi:hypothetical protein